MSTDQQIKSLVKGDVFAYPYAEGELLIVKVETITISGTTVTITGTDMEMGEVFAYVKIDAVADPELAEVDANYIGNGVTYLQSGANLSDAYLPQDTGISEEVVIDYILDIKGDINLTGKLTAKAKLKLEFYITKNHQRITLALDYGLAIGVEVEADFSSKPISVPIGKLKFPVLPGVSVDFVPSFVFSATVTANLTLNFDGTFGVAINHTKDGWDVDNLCSTPDPYLELGVEGKVFAGLQLTPALKLLGGFLADVEIKGQLGLQLSGKISVSTELISDMRHNCVGCVDGEVGFVLKITPSVQFLKSDKLKLETTLVNATFKVNDFYISPMSGIGWGECPNIAYKLTLVAVDEAGNPVADALVTIDEGSDLDCQTNEKGIAQLYLSSELHSIEVHKEGFRYWTELVTDHSRKLTAKLKDTSSGAEPGGSDEWENPFVGDEDNDFVDAPINPHVYLEDLPISNSARYTGNEGDSFIKKLGTRNGTVDIHGNAMDHGLEAWIARWNYTREISWAWVEYDLMKQYAFLSGKLTIVSDCYNRSSFNSTIEIIGDGNVLYSSLMLPGMDAIPINVNVHGIETLRIYVYDNESAKGGTSFGLWDFGLTYSTDDYSENGNTSVEVNAVYPGMNSTEITDTYALKTASFKDLIPNEQYVLLAMASIEVEDPLASDNLLFIDQAAAAEDGTLTFRYVQRTPCDISYVVACGASHKNLNDAEISFPKMVADGELQVVDPVVVYDGKTLTEGRDYVIVGTVDFTDSGTYTCFIRGVHNYTGLVECSYTVGQRENPFTDVASDSFYFEPVLWAVENGVTSGTSATTFDPSGLCLRAHVVTFLYCAAGSPVPSSNKNPFTDVKSGDFYYNPVLWAVENGITQGISKTQFGSAQVCNRAAVVTFLWRAFGSPEPKSTNNPFVDVKNTDFFYKPVLWAVENGITAGIDATHFNPAGACNRAQVVTFLYKAYN